MAIWEIKQKVFTGEMLTSIQLKSQITTFDIYPDDSYIIAGCLDNNVYIIRSDLNLKVFETINVLIAHDSFISSITLDPMIKTTGRFASLSDKGRLIIASFDQIENHLNLVYNYDDFVNLKHRCVITKKKIDWSPDGQLIVSVDHHQFNRQNVIHARIVNLNNLANTQALLGHDSPIYIVSFSKCIYIDRNKTHFQLCATSDQNGNLIIWKITNSNFNVLIDIEGFSEKNITDMLWSKDGEYLITVNSIGSVCSIKFTEFIVENANQNSQMDFNDNNNSSIETFPIDGIQTKDKGKVIITYENVQEEYALIQMKILLGLHPKTLFAKKLIGKNIKLFCANNFFFAFYCNDCSLSVFSLLNSMMLGQLFFEELDYLTAYQQYLLLITSKSQKIIIYDVITKTKIIDEYLHIDPNPSNMFKTSIENIDFKSLNQIIIQIQTNNPYNNKNTKMTLFFDSQTKNLVSYCDEKMKLDEIKEIEHVKSVYNSYFEEKITIDLIKEEKMNTLIMISSAVDSIYDNLYRAKYFGLKDLFISNIHQLINLVKETNHKQYQLILDDFFLLNKDLSSEEMETITKILNQNKLDS